MELIVAVLLAFGFSLTNGFHDAANAIAALVATRAATPLAAIVMASVFNILGPLLLGAAVAETVGGIVQLSSTEAVEVIGAALTAAVAWNVFTWRMGLPSSSSHALIGGLVGAALVAGGADAVNWGGFDGLKPTGVIGVLVVMAVSPVVGVAAGAAGELAGRRALRRATQAVNGPIKGGLWVTSASLAFSHGANDAAKTVGVVAALAGGRRPDQHPVGRPAVGPARERAGAHRGDRHGRLDRSCAPSAAASTACVRSTGWWSPAARPG